MEVTDINGEPCLLIIGRDITARKQAENALRESERQFRAVFDTALDAMLVSDNSRRYVNANPAACALFDLPREELIGRLVTDFSATPNEEAAERGWQHFLTQGQMQGEITIRTATGALRAAEYTAVANFLPGQHLTVLRDITERQSGPRRRYAARKNASPKPSGPAPRAC